MRLTKIISGGQTGADRGGLDAAIEMGVPHGGWCPKGRKAEDGVIPERYKLQETESADYPERTKRNIQEADATVVITFGRPGRGSALTIRTAEALGKPVLCLDMERIGYGTGAKELSEWLGTINARTLNVAGSRESSAGRGFGGMVRRMIVLALSEGLAGA